MSRIGSATRRFSVRTLPLATLPLAAAVLAGCLALSACAGCASATPGPPGPANVSSAQTSPAGTARLGALLRQGPAGHLAPALAAIADATYISYVSFTPSGAPIPVSGAVYVPKGTPPAGGWPLVAYAHATTGVTRDCAPTLSPDMFGNEPMVADLVGNRHWAVVMTDYQGLGGPGVHPYLDSTAQGLDVLGSIRAARSLGVPLARSTALYGFSQGGRASEAAAELAPTRTPEITLVGNAMISPALELDVMAAIDAGTFTPVQYAISPLLVRGLQAVDPSIRTDEILHGPLLRNNAALLACTGASVDQVAALLKGVSPADVRPEGSARPAMTAYFERNQLPRTPNRAVPDLVRRGSADALVTPAWTADAVRRLCAGGVRVQQEIRPGGHYAASDIASAGAWVADRFAGLPAPSTC